MWLRRGQVSDAAGHFARGVMLGTITINLPDPATVPTASLNAADITAPGSQPYRFEVTYRDDVGIEPLLLGADPHVRIGGATTSHRPTGEPTCNATLRLRAFLNTTVAPADSPASCWCGCC